MNTKSRSSNSRGASRSNVLGTTKPGYSIMQPFVADTGRNFARPHGGAGTGYRQGGASQMECVFQGHECSSGTEDGSKSYSSTMQSAEENNAQRLHHFFRDLYKHNQLTDLKIKVGSYTFNVHRGVLACFSPYLANKVLQSENIQEITLDKTVTPPGFKKVIDYIYNNEITVEVEDLAEILQAANVLQIPELQERCSAILESAPSAALVEILEIAHKQEIRFVCDDRILEKLAESFLEVRNLEEFNDLCVDCATTLLSRDDVVVNTEQQIAQTIINWVRTSPDDRLALLPEVFACVRLENMSSDEIIRLGKDAPFLLHNQNVREHILRAHWYKRSVELGDNVNIDEIELPKQRKYVPETPALRLCRNPTSKPVGGVSGPSKSDPGGKFQTTAEWVTQRTSCAGDHMMKMEPKMMKIPDDLPTFSAPWGENPPSTRDAEIAVATQRKRQDFSQYILRIRKDQKRAVEKFPISEQRWVRSNIALPADFTASNCLRVGSVLLFTGGLNLGAPLDDVWALDILTDKWRQLPRLNTPRYLHCTVALDGRVYVVGGIDGRGRPLTDMESLVLDPMEDPSWDTQQPMPTSRFGASAAAGSDMIYVAGGLNGSAGTFSTNILTSVACYYPRYRTWDQVEPLRIPRYRASMIAHDNKLYIIGGIISISHKEVEASADVDVMDTRNGWSPIVRMSRARYDATVEIANNKLYVVGGTEIKMDDEVPRVEQEQVVEVLNLKNHTWMPEIDLGPCKKDAKFAMVTSSY